MLDKISLNDPKNLIEFTVAVAGCDCRMKTQRRTVAIPGARFFGVPYSLLVGIILISVLAVNRRIKLLTVILLGEVIHFLVLATPSGINNFSLNEHLSNSITIAYILTTACIHCDLVDEYRD